MADKAIISNSTLNDIGQAIIDKGGATSPILPKDMPAAIRSIHSEDPSGINDVKLNGVSLPVVGKSVNVQIKRNGSSLVVSEGSVNVLVPTKTSELTNDSEFLTENDIVDDVSTGGSNKALSAEQGKCLGRRLDGVMPGADVTDIQMKIRKGSYAYMSRAAAFGNGVFVFSENVGNFSGGNVVNVGQLVYTTDSGMTWKRTAFEHAIGVRGMCYDPYFDRFLLATTVQDGDTSFHARIAVAKLVDGQLVRQDDLFDPKESHPAYDTTCFFDVCTYKTNGAQKVVVVGNQLLTTDGLHTGVWKLDINGTYGTVSNVAVGGAGIDVPDDTRLQSVEASTDGSVLVCSRRDVRGAVPSTKGHPYMYWSSDGGMTWAACEGCSQPSSGSSEATHIRYANGRFIAVGMKSYKVVMVSSDGKSFVEKDPFDMTSVSNVITDVAYVGRGIWVACNQNSEYSTCSVSVDNGDSWEVTIGATYPFTTANVMATDGEGLVMCAPYEESSAAMTMLGRWLCFGPLAQSKAHTSSVVAGDTIKRSDFAGVEKVDKATIYQLGAKINEILDILRPYDNMFI